MSGSPYMPPSGDNVGYAPNPNFIRDQLKPPAICIIVAMSIGMLFQILGVAMNLLGVGLGAAADSPEGLQVLVQGTLGVVFGIISLGIGGFVIFACTKMMKLEGYVLSMAGVILAMLPCVSPCCLLGLPFGIWAIVVMNKPEVKAAFRG